MTYIDALIADLHTLGHATGETLPLHAADALAEMKAENERIRPTLRAIKAALRVSYDPINRNKSGAMVPDAIGAMQKILQDALLSALAPSPPETKE